jgi:pSer/pThr/pTyr-binding forkhead associated (FHA) protein
MDDPKQSADSGSVPLPPVLKIEHGLKMEDREPGSSIPHPQSSNILPLRLLVQPDGAALEVNRPEMIVGRHSEADIRLRSPEVSRRHCRFVLADGHWQIFDLNSLNGVWLNGLRVQHAVLQNKDVLHIGAYDFEVEIGPTTLPMSSPAPEQPHKKAS